MLFTADAWAGIADGSITVTFRTWSRPQAKVGGRYRVGGSTIEATAVERVEAGSITDADAHAAGAPDRAAVLRRLGDPPDDTLVWNEEKQGHDFAEPDWNEFFEVLKGNGPCNKQRLGARVKAWNDGEWFRDALVAHADKSAARRAAAKMAAE